MAGPRSGAKLDGKDDDVRIVLSHSGDQIRKAQVVHEYRVNLFLKDNPFRFGDQIQDASDMVAGIVVISRTL